MLGKLGGGSLYCGGKAIAVCESVLLASVLGYVVPNRMVETGDGQEAG